MFAVNNWSPLQNANSVLFSNSSLELRLITWCFRTGFVETDVAYTLQRPTGHSKGRCYELHLPEGLVTHIQCCFTLTGMQLILSLLDCVLTDGGVENVPGMDQ